MLLEPIASAAPAFNPCRDYFAGGQVLERLRSSRTLVADADVRADFAFHPSIAQLKIGATPIVEPAFHYPDTYYPGRSGKLTLALPNHSFPFVANQTYLVGFSYQISGELEVSVTPEVSNASILLKQPGDLRAHQGKHFAFFLFRPAEGQTASGVKFTLTAFRGVPGPTAPAVDLSDFVIYLLYDYDVRYQLWGALPAEPGMAIETGWLSPRHRLWKAAGVAPPPSESWANLTLVRRQTPPADLEVFATRRRSNAAGYSQPNYVFVFPGQHKDQACEFAIIHYVSQLDHYGLMELPGNPTALTMDEHWLLDANKFRTLLPPRTGSRSVDWAIRCEPVIDPFAAWVNTTGILDLDLLFRHYQRIGFSTLFADTSLRPASEIKALQAQLLALGLRLSFTFHWQSALVLGGSGTRFRLTNAGGSAANNLFKNPLLNDVLEMRAITERFLGSNPALDAVLASDPSRPVMIETPEIGDTQVGFPFALPPVEGEADPIQAVRDGLAAARFDLVHASTDPNGQLAFARVENAPIAADAQYRLGFLPFVFDLLNALVTFKYNRNSRGPNAVAFGWLDVEDTAAGLEAVPGSAGVIDFAHLAAMSPSNGPHGPTEYLFPLPFKMVVERRNEALAGRATNRDALWYFQFRYWTQVNVAYLCAADGALRRAARNRPVWHWSSLSKDGGYQAGFEPYHVAKSGALDIIWMDDGYSRLSAVWPNLIFSNVLADYARALAHAPRAGLGSSGLPLRIGAFVHTDRPDYKAIVWAARGARHFELFYSGDTHFEGNFYGWGNSGFLAHQWVKQAKLAIDVLDRAARGLSLENRPPAKIAMVIPQSDNIWLCGNSGTGIDDKGFVAPFVLENGFHGLHAMLTHLQLPLDLVFEEELAAAPGALEPYTLVFVSSLCLRDDAFYALAAWVEAGNRVAVFSPVTRDGKLWPPVLFNEFARYRSSRRQWFGLDAAVPDAASFVDPSPPDGWPSGTGSVLLKREKGAVLLLPTGLEADSAGTSYIYELELQSLHSFLARSTPEAAALRNRLHADLTKACQMAGVRPDWFDAWRSATVAPLTPQPEMLVEVTHIQSGTLPASGVVFVVNHRQRAAVRQTAGLDEADDAECTKQPDRCEVTLKGLPARVRIWRSRDAAPPSTLTTSGGVLKYPLQLQDYEILFWKELRFSYP